MNEKTRQRAPKPNQGRMTQRIRPPQQEAIAKQYDRRMRKGERGEDIIFDLAQKYHRDDRTIQRHIRKGREIIAKKRRAKGGQPGTDARPDRAISEAIQKWRAELESYTPVQLARLWLKETWKETAHDFRSNEESKRLFHEAQRAHFQKQKIPGIRLGVESDPGFRLLRQKFPTSSAWAQLDVWSKQVIPYLSAYWALLNEIETTEGCLPDRDSFLTSEAPPLGTSRWVVCRWAVAMACHLLAKGLGELPGDVSHGLLIADLEKLQAEVGLEMLLLTNRALKGGPARDAERIWADPQDTGGLIQRTRECLSNWIKLQSVQDSLLVAIQEMESNS